MTLMSSFSLFLSLMVLALIPGPGILAVTARTASIGLRHGVSATAGIVAGDFVFITLALLGLSALSELMGSFFIIIKYAGAAYLVWLGFSLLISKPAQDTPRKGGSSAHASSFLIGLVTTLSNPKAILFYLSFFPAFINLSAITLYDAVNLYLIATVAVGSVMLGYAYIAHTAKSAYKGINRARGLRIGSGAMLVGSGIYVATRG